MERQEFITTIDRCLKNAFLDVTWSFSTDEDYVANLSISKDDRLIFRYVKTPYRIADVRFIKYSVNEHTNDCYIVLFTDDGNSLQIGESKGRAYILLHTGKTDDIYLYRGPEKHL